MTGSKNKSLPTTSPQLRVGVLCDSLELSAWQVECLNFVSQLGFAPVELFIVNHAPSTKRPSILSRLRSKIESGLLLWRMYERSVLERKSAALKSVSLPPSLSNVQKVEVEPIKVGRFRQTFSPESIKVIKEHNLDVLVRFGFGILTGEILEVPRFGIWSFHHGDPSFFRGAPPGFWEIVNGAAVTGTILQRLTESLDGGVVLHSGWFKTNAANYVKSLDRLLFGAAHFLGHALAELRCNPEAFIQRTSIENSGPIYRYPRTAAMLRFFAKTSAAKLRDQFTSLFRHQQWSIGISAHSLEATFASLSGRSGRAEEIEWFAEPAGAFLADPFAVQISGETSIIVEEFNWKTGLGRISTVSCSQAGGKSPQPAIISDHHLSYPYTFECGQEIYCVPECAASNGLSFYRFAPEEGRWIKEKRALEGFPAIDPTIFFHENRWWLFCTSAETGPNEFLYAWFADEPLGDWTPHAANPLKVDIRASRPAGRPFLSKGVLIRPAQDCSQIYGGAITFNRVVTLTPEQFVEEPAGQLLPAAGRYSASLHTISACGERTVFDGARLRFVPSEFWRSLRKKLAAARE